MRYLLSICLLGLLICCGQKKSHSSNAELAEVTADDSLEIVECVTKIYEEVFDFYNSNENVSMVDFDTRYLSDAFKRAYLMLDEAHSQRLNEFAGIGYDHWIQAQDWEKLSMHVNSVKFERNPIVNITILHRGNTIQHTDINLDVVLTKEDDGRWTIDDFINNGKSERALIQTLMDDVESSNFKDVDDIEMNETEEFGIEMDDEQVYDEYEEEDPLMDVEAELASTHQETLG